LNTVVAGTPTSCRMTKVRRRGASRHAASRPRSTSSEVLIDPRWLFPLLAAVFAVSTLVRVLRARRLDPAARTWALLAVAFGAVSAWLHLVAR
jgi:hypothetical protein